MTRLHAVDLWLLDLSNQPEAEILHRWADYLSLTERAKADRYRQSERRAQSIAGRALLRHALSFSAGGNPEAWEIGLDENGRPHLVAGEPDIDFNVSHTDGMVVCAISKRYPVGIDVEHENRAALMAEVETRFLCEQEREVWQRKSQEDATAFLAQLWTLKEAWAKTSGLGLQADFTSAQFEIQATGQITLLSKPDWKFHNIKCQSGHFISVACQCPDDVSFNLRSGEALLDAPLGQL